MSASFSPTRKFQIRKRLPQVPNLITSTKKKRSAPPPPQHKFLVINSLTPSPTNSPRSIIASNENKPLPGIGMQPSPGSVKNNTQNLDNNEKFPYDKDFNEFLTELLDSQIHTSMENLMRKHYQTKEATLWYSIPELQMLFSRSLNSVIPESQGLIGSVLTKGNLLRLTNPSSHQSYYKPVDSTICGGNCSALIFPIFDYQNNLWGIMCVVREQSEFTQEDEDFANWFANKFMLLSKWMKVEIPLDELTSEIMNLIPITEFVQRVNSKLTSIFDCQSAEIWKYDKNDSQNVIRYTNQISNIEFSKAGIVSDVISKKMALNFFNVKTHSKYNPDVDDTIESAALIIPIDAPEEGIIFAIALRRPNNSKVFTKSDENALRKIAPLILLGLTNCEAFSQYDEELKDSKKEKEGLEALLEVVEIISSQLNSDNLVELIMEKGRTLTDSDRCSLFLVNDDRDRLRTFLHKGLKNAIDIPINKGIVGKSAVEGKILNIEDAYEYPFFDSAVDLESGYKTKSILSVPIFNSRSEIIGVTEMVNKKNDVPFSAYDEKLIQLFNVFCGISLENSRLFNESLEMNNKLSSFFDTAFSMAKSESLQRIFSDIMQNAKHSINADRATIFLTQEGKDELSTFVVDGDKVPNSISIKKGIVGHVAQTKTPMYDNNVYSNDNKIFDRSIDFITGYKTKSILATPILSSSGELLGVVEMLNKKKGDFEKRDLKVIEAFSTFCAIALEKQQLKNMANLVDSNIELKKWIPTEERNLFTTPELLKLNPEQIEKVSSLNCFAVDFIGMNHFKEIFYFFDYFKLREVYKIKNENFFKFIFTISSTYNDVPYHNWTHACDVCQYVFYEIITAKLQDRYTSLELYGIFVSAVCHDANHQGFNNIFNVKAETPLGILFKDQSVMEMHHVEQSIPIIARDDINLFGSLNQEDTRKIWNIFVKLILATDMAKHFEIVKRTTAIMDEGGINWEDNEQRLLTMQLILKVADISNVSRPFEYADKWCDILCNEFYRQGDLEKSTGIGLTSPLNDRDNNDKPKSQIGFYNFICLPLYSITARVFPELQVNADSVASNLEKWKELAAASAPANPSN